MGDMADMVNDDYPDDNYQGNEMTYLTCDHCGDVAVESDDGMFDESMANQCMTCGFLGRVSIDEDRNEAEFILSDDLLAVCDILCGECIERTQALIGNRAR